MRILYGVCGEGFGHSSRAKEIIEHLESKGHKVLIITYGQAVEVLSKFDLIEIEGISLSFSYGRLSLSKTIIENFSKIPKNIKNFGMIKDKIDKFKPDLYISDMEVLVPIISHWKKLPLISIDNQHRLTHLELDVPKEHNKDFLIAKTAINLCVSRADAFIIMSFAKSKVEKDNGKTYVVNPLLRKEILDLKTKEDNFFLVYQTKKDKELLNVLSKINEKFVIYGYNKEKQRGNLIFKKTGKLFIKDLANCKGIIATSGFTLMSEAIYLKKPYFALPLTGQFEQTLNSLFLKKAIYGDYSLKPTEVEIRKFIDNLDNYKHKLSKNKPKPKETLEILDKLLKSFN
ncbi:MAG: glycosyltransferase family protein [Nanoarchaeota archaeon]